MYLRFGSEYSRNKSPDSIFHTWDVTSTVYKCQNKKKKFVWKFLCFSFLVTNKSTVQTGISKNVFRQTRDIYWICIENYNNNIYMQRLTWAIAVEKMAQMELFNFGGLSWHPVILTSFYLVLKKKGWKCLLVLNGS